MLKRSRNTAILIAWLCLLVSLTARADTLTSQAVSRFIASMEAMQNSETFTDDFMSAWRPAGRTGTIRDRLCHPRR